MHIRSQLNVLAATEVHSIAVVFPPARWHGGGGVFNQLAHPRAVVVSFIYALMCVGML